MKAKSFFFGLLVGSAAGAATILLTTPKNGNEYRQMIKDNSNKVLEVLDNVKQESALLTKQVKDASREGVIILKDFTNDVKTSVAAWKNDIEPSQARIEEELKSIEKSIQQLENSMKLTKN